jgi:cold shock CspA family protein
MSDTMTAGVTESNTAYTTSVVEVPEPEIHEGECAVYFDQKGFGFIDEVLPDGLTFHYFFHINDCRRGIPRAGLKVRFIAVEGKKKLLAAKQVEVIAPAKVGS